MIDDVVLNKSESIERCIKQVKKYYAMPSDITFDEDFLRQDAIALNLQRACEQAIDLANHVIKVYKFGLPKESRDSFDILARNGAISSELAGRLQSMVGFRNTLVHQYQNIDIHIMVAVIEKHLDDFLHFTRSIIGFSAPVS
ncbi:MAG: DUF86 domain-containing protein [Chlorobiales bacterium]|nr:DUF86 domain-containing protein [Chlorobiales bacterium]